MPSTIDSYLIAAKYYDSAYAEYGSFARTPLDNTAEEMIFLLRRARQ
jgi:hypothetical protein